MGGGIVSIPSGISWDGIGPIHWDTILSALLVGGTWYLAIRTQQLVKTSKKMAEKHLDVTKQQSADHLSMLKTDMSIRLAISREDLYTSSQMLEHRRCLARQLARGAPHEEIDHPVLDFFDVVGILLKKGHLDRGLALNFWGYASTRYWKALDDYIPEDRRRNPLASLWHEYEYLVGELGGALYSDEEIARFLEEEMNLGGMAAAYQTLGLTPPGEQSD